jgi:Flp pilus assembly protein TadG
MFKNARDFASRCRNSTSGTITIVFGLSALALATVIGVALDASRAFNISSRVQNVIDAAALAGARKLLLDDANNGDVRDTAISYFEAQEGQFKVWGAVPSNPRVDIDRSAMTVTVTVDVTMLSIAGSLSSLMPSMSFSPTSTASFEQKRIELAMVLDITGSMCDAPPASAASACSSGTKINGLKDAAEDIIKVLANAAPAPGYIRVGLVPYSASVNVGPYFGSVAAGPHGDTCVVERSGVDAFNDNAPAGASLVGTSDTGSAWFYSCPPSQIVPLTDVASSTQRNMLINKVKDLKAFGGTAGHIGTAWGWYMVSPRWTDVWPSSADPRPKSTTVTKAVLLMTDGDFNIAYANGGETVPWPDAGATDVNHPGSSPNQGKQLCDNMKLDGVTIYSVAFQAPPAAEALLKDCSGGSNFYDASSAQELKAAFRDIADKLTALRLSH